MRVSLSLSLAASSILECTKFHRTYKFFNFIHLKERLIKQQLGKIITYDKHENNLKKCMFVRKAICIQSHFDLVARTDFGIHQVSNLRYRKVVNRSTSHLVAPPMMTYSLWPFGNKLIFGILLARATVHEYLVCYVF